MKKLVVLLLILWSFAGFAQYEPYCLYDFAGWYRLSTVNPSTGVITQIGPIPPAAFYVLGNKQCISTHDSTYTFSAHDGTNARLYTITLDSANILYDPVFNGNVVGLKYNCNDSTIYAIEENGGGYDFVTVDKTTGLTTQKGFVSGVTAYVGDAFVLDEKRGLYHFFGLFGGSIKMYTIDIQTGMVTSSPFFPDNVTGLAYNCKDSTVYGLWEDGPDYKLEKLDPVNGTHSTVGVLANIDPGFVGESATINYNGEYVYRGFSNTQSVLVTINVKTAVVLDTTSFTSNISGLDYYVCCKEPITVSVEEKPVLSDVTLYPNPFKNLFTIEFNQPIENGQLELIDVNGKRVYFKNNIHQKRQVINLKELPKGLYFVRIKDHGELYWQGKVVSY